MNSKMKKILLAPMNLLYTISPKTEICLMFLLRNGYKLNLKEPATFNEKLNWMKLYYRNDYMPMCADKYAVRKYVEESGCGELLTNLLWEGFDAKDIPFNDLPDKFVIKVTHGAGNNIICKSKSELNISKTISTLNKWLKEKYLPAYGEWFYGIEKPRIIVEEFLSPDGATLPKDYKLYCFNNIDGDHGVGMTAIYQGRYTDKFNKTIFNSKWEKISDVVFGENINTSNLIVKPTEYDKLVDYALKLAKPFPHARVDFYIINNKIYFSEITFMTGAGYNKISPRSFDEKLGSWIRIENEGELY